MLDLEFRHVDVFSTTPFSGNGLVVVLGADGLDADIMQTVTQEMRQFESTFVAGLDMRGRTAALRIFTVEEELEFAGHPVLGAAAVFQSMLGEGEPEARWELDLRGRRVLVRTRQGDGRVDATMDQGVAVFGEPASGDLLAQYVAGLGLAPADLHPELPVQVVSTGLPYLMVPVRGAGLGRAAILHEDFGRLLGESGAKFVYVLDAERPEGRTWDNAGRVEDVATGSAAGPTGAYLIRHGLRPPASPMLIHQGRFVGRPSQIEVVQDDDGHVWVGGPVVPVALGRFHARTS